MNKILIEEHGTAYAWINKQLWAFPMYTDGTIENKQEYACIVEESPIKHKGKQIGVLKQLGVKKQEIKATIKKIGYYKEVKNR